MAVRGIGYAPDIMSHAVDRTRPALADRTDGQLASAVVARSSDAYGELYRRHRRSVHAASRMILGYGPESEDVVAEVFVAFWLHPERFDAGRSSLLGYLRMKARGRSIDVLRAKTSRRHREERVALSDRPPAVELESGLLASEAAAELHAAVSLLPTRECEVVSLAFFSGMTYGEVARHLGVPEGTVKSRVRAGLHHLALDGGMPAGIAADGRAPAWPSRSATPLVRR